MELKDWLPVYEEILKDFGYHRGEDEESARFLADFLSGREAPGLSMIEDIIKGKKVLVVGPAMDDAIESEAAGHDAIICADDAIAGCRKLDIMPDIIVTDLDGDIPAILKANRMGSLAVVHAHGDNLPALKRWLPDFDGDIIGTCQCPPPPGIYNFGGFTDGDRAVLTAAHFGAAGITLAGFDFQKPVPKEGKDPEVKKKKLAWAEKIIGMIDVEIVNHS